jgi:hypothetical protein
LNIPYSGGSAVDRKAILRTTCKCMDFGKLSWAFEPGLLRAPRRRAAAMTEQLGPFTPCMGSGIGDLGDGCAGVSHNSGSHDVEYLHHPELIGTKSAGERTIGHRPPIHQERLAMRSRASALLQHRCLIISLPNLHSLSS